MATSEICFAIQPDLQWENFVHFHVFSAQDFLPFRDLSFETPSQETPTEDLPLMEPQDRVLDFGMFRGQTYSFVLLNHFGDFCWAISQNDP
eukprot:5377948-Alexandrium_andersonii.AAC.1